MKLRDIDIRVENLKTVIVRPGCIEHLYLKKLPKVETGEVAKVNIYLSNESAFKINDLTANTLSCTTFFDDKKYLAAKNNRERKFVLLDRMVSALIECAANKHWEKDPFLDAYNECVSLDLKNEWWFKSKQFKSPGHRYFAGLYNVYDLDSYTIYLVIFDAFRNEIGRQIVFKDTFLSFELEVSSWDSDEIFTFKFRSAKKVFKIPVSDVINRVPYIIPEKTSDFFK